MKAKLLLDQTTVIRDDKRRIVALDILPVGSIIDHPKAWRLVSHGVAEPADKECEDKCPQTQAQRAAAHLWQVKQLALQKAARDKAAAATDTDTEDEDDDE